MVQLNNDDASIFLLWYQVNTSTKTYHNLVQAFGTAYQALQASANDWESLGVHPNHVVRHKTLDFKKQQDLLSKLHNDLEQQKFQLLFKTDEHYPTQLTHLYDSPPLLFYRGDATRLSDPQIAIVGSRKPTDHAQKLTFDMAQYLAGQGFVITSGLAQGVDGHAHLGALAQSQDMAGRTIGVMGTGIDVIYPKQHAHLITRIVAEGGCVVTELLPGTLASKHTFPRRNRLVAGLSLGTIVTEAAVKSGSLITARLTAEQGKQVFAVPSRIDNSNAEGCHHLIREGATLIYHPDQVIEDLMVQLPDPDLNPQSDTGVVAYDSFVKFESTASKSRSTPAKPSKNNNSPAPKSDIKIPEHLQPIWTHLDFAGQDLDALVTKTELDTPELLSSLMELELMGAIEQMGGRYRRKLGG